MAFITVLWSKVSAFLELFEPTMNYLVTATISGRAGRMVPILYGPFGTLEVMFAMRLFETESVVKDAMRIAMFDSDT